MCELQDGFSGSFSIVLMHWTKILPDFSHNFDGLTELIVSSNNYNNYFTRVMLLIFTHEVFGDKPYK